MAAALHVGLRESAIDHVDIQRPALTVLVGGGKAGRSRSPSVIATTVKLGARRDEGGGGKDEQH